MSESDILSSSNALFVDCFSTLEKIVYTENNFFSVTKRIRYGFTVNCFLESKITFFMSFNNAVVHRYATLSLMHIHEGIANPTSPQILLV